MSKLQDTLNEATERFTNELMDLIRSTSIADLFSTEPAKPQRSAKPKRAAKKTKRSNIRREPALGLPSNVELTQMSDGQWEMKIDGEVYTRATRRRDAIRKARRNGLFI